MLTLVFRGVIIVIIIKWSGFFYISLSRSVGIVRSRTKATELVKLLVVSFYEPVLCLQLAFGLLSLHVSKQELNYIIIIIIIVLLLLLSCWVSTQAIKDWIELNYIESEIGLWLLISTCK
jgi:hypothetical protein